MIRVIMAPKTRGYLVYDHFDLDAEEVAAQIADCIRMLANDGCTVTVVQIHETYAVLANQQPHR